MQCDNCSAMKRNFFHALDSKAEAGEHELEHTENQQETSAQVSNSTDHPRFEDYD
jgi:hypothetical protein